MHLEHPGEELLSGCLHDSVGVVSPGQVLADVNPEEPETADGDGGCCPGTKMSGL